VFFLPARDAGATRRKLDELALSLIS
jgi:hypothetical protein